MEHIRSFENLVNYDKSKTLKVFSKLLALFENLVNYDKSKTYLRQYLDYLLFENLVNYDKSKTTRAGEKVKVSLRTL